MAGSSLLTLIDDIAGILDDVAVLTKIATKKTAGVLGDDLALNAEQVAGVDAKRELPVVWAVAKGSAVNKLILVPAALLISAVAPWAISPLLMVGGAYLCFEGFEKVAHKLFHAKEDGEARHAELANAIADPQVDMVAFEKEKIRGAVRTDFVLSAEIVVIALGTVAAETFAARVGVLTAIAALMTVGVYSLVAGIVKLDDAGIYLSRVGGRAAFLGRWLVLGAPYLMKGLSIAGTAAMFLVGGGILAHGVPGAESGFERLADHVERMPGVGIVLELVLPSVLNGLVGVLAGGVLVAAVTAAKRLRRPASG